MRIVCDQCGATEPPGDVWRSGERVALECAACGFICPVIPRASAAKNAPSRTAEADEPTEAVVSAKREDSDGSGTTTPPHQCMKCGHRQHDDTSCHRCGFVFEHYQPGAMPWEQVPEGMEETVAEAEQLWAAALESGETQDHDAFVTFCTSNDLEDLAGRKYRFQLADHPEDSVSRARLDEMLERGKARIFARLESTKGDIEREARALRRTVLWGVFAISIVLALLFLSLYPNVLG